jgi:hypothetical protein
VMLCWVSIANCATYTEMLTNIVGRVDNTADFYVESPGFRSHHVDRLS